MLGSKLIYSLLSWGASWEELLFSSGNEIIGTILTVIMMWPTFGILMINSWLFNLIEQKNIGDQAIIIILNNCQALFFLTTALIFILWIVWRSLSKIKKLKLPVLKANFWFVFWLVIFLSWSILQVILKIDLFKFNYLIWPSILLTDIALLILVIKGVKKIIRRLKIKYVYRKKSKEEILRQEKNGRIFWKVMTGLISVWIFGSVLMVVGWILIAKSPMASYYAVLNAAIKNTCFIDPEKENCPRTLEELSYIEPEEFKRKIAVANVQANYFYDEEVGFYTLVIRYQPERAVVFDWRLVDELGLGRDFVEVDVDIWQNKIKGMKYLSDLDEKRWQFEEWNWARGWGRNNGF